MRLPRASGILLHPTSLPGPFGVGDLGPSAHDFLDFLTETGQRWWQILPLGPTGYGNSPYQSYSSHAGNTLLISPELLARDGLLSTDDWAEYPALSEDRVDFEAAIAAKEALLHRAHERFTTEPPEFHAFVEANAHWLDGYTLFMALKDHYQGAPWYEWEAPLVHREADALAQYREKLDASVRYYQFTQFQFARQWKGLRDSCRSRGIQVLGDLPIFVAQDSADVWTRPDLFWLDEHNRPTFVAGVPPDYFSATGQLWGNPLYKWEAHVAEHFAWWVDRLKSQLARVDMVRLDHFRGFQAYWEIPAGSLTAEKGRWALGPGTAFLEAIREALGNLPLVAEDLGDITPEVLALRDLFDLPGMRVLQFGLQGDPGTDFHLPFRYVNHCVAYTGTHDNDTTLGWFSARPGGSEAEQAYRRKQVEFARSAVGAHGDEVYWDAIRSATASVADTVVIPLQDVLGLGCSARMNVPGNPVGNWSWRFRSGQIRPDTRARLAELTTVFGRWNGEPPPPFDPPHAPSGVAKEHPPEPIAEPPQPSADAVSQVGTKPKRKKASPKTKP
jgi:4-alpha-glucanotransferase